MAYRNLIAALVLTVLSVPANGTRAADAIYPDWKGQWGRIGPGNWDPTKPRGLDSTRR